MSGSESGRKREMMDRGRRQVRDRGGNIAEENESGIGQGV